MGLELAHSALECAMATYILGDIQGCCGDLRHLLDQLHFSESDQLWLVGDLVNRGPNSLDTLRLLYALGPRVTCVLGNHDLHLLAVSVGARALGKSDTLAPILDAPDRDELLSWLRARPLAHYGQGVLMVHAGVLPQWSLVDTLTYAAEVSRVLQSPQHVDFFNAMYGNQPAQWSAELQGMDRLRAIVNGLTRLRFCTADGVMDFATTDSAANPPAGYLPWFAVPQRATQATPIAFGHWSTLGLHNEPNLIALDTGCVWGGKLTACRLPDDVAEAHNPAARTLIQVDCPQHQSPF